MKSTNWVKTSEELRFFNHEVQERETTGNRSVGIFNERYGCNAHRWTVRVRLNYDGHIWCNAVPFDSKREAVAFADENYPEWTAATETARVTA